MKLPLWLGHVIAAIVSLLAAFFGVFNVLFSDILTVQSQLGAIGYVFVVYLVLSLLLHWLWPGRGWTWYYWLLIPGLVFALFSVVTDFGRFWYPLGVVVAMKLGIWLGKWLGGRRRQTTVASSA